MKQPMILAAILSLSFTSACGNEPARVEITTPNRAQFKTCLDASYTPPENLPPYEAFNLPDGTAVVPLKRVQERDRINAAFAAQVIYAHSLCRASTVYADRWSEEMQQRAP